MVKDRIEVRVYLPSRDREGRELPLWLKDTIETIAVEEMCKQYGGSTKTTGYGEWINPETKELCKENVNVISSYTTQETYEKGKPELEARLEFIKAYSRQSALLYATIPVGTVTLL